MEKSWLQSKTVWFNALTVLVVVASFFGYESNPDVAEQAQVILVSVAPLINIALRFVTDKAIR